MPRKFPPLATRQIEVLQWVADGCPDGVWEDFTYKTTSYALANRRLVEVDRRRNSWSAVLTDDGRYYLTYGTYRAGAKPVSAGGATSSRQRARTRTERPFSVDAVELLGELQRGDGTLTLSEPTAAVRAGYRNALSRAVNRQLVPDGYRLRHSGRDHGDMVIRLVLDDREPARDPLAPIRVPEDLRDAPEAVRQLAEAPDLVDVSDEARPRALLILSAVALECEVRGWEFAAREDNQPTFQISVSGVRFDFCLFEEIERRDMPNADELESAKYPWQRVRSTVQQVRSGRLALRLGGQRSALGWADRKRWRLDDKLPHLFEHVANAAADALIQRERAARLREERVHVWEEAVAQARVQFIADFNRRRLGQQLSDRAQATQMRAYAADVELVGDRARDQESLLGWVAWVREEADRMDPLLRPDGLKELVPQEVRPTDLEPFMPKGMNAWGPPK